MSFPVFVVDTNVVVAGLLTGSADSPVVATLDAMLTGSVLYLLSPELVNEYRLVLLRPKLRKLHGLDEAAIEQLLVELTANAVWCEPEPGPRAPDPGDDHLWALLDTHSGSILVTGDQLLLENPLKDRLVITPRTWLADFASNGAPRA